MLGSSVPASFSVKQSPHLCVSQASPINAHLKFFEVEAKNIRKTRPTTAVFQCLSSANYFRPSLNKPKSSLVRTVTTRVTDEYDGSGGSADPTSQVHSSLDSKEASISSSTLGDGYVLLFVRMLGLDNDPLDREQAIIALWKYSLGGKKFVDNIMQFPGCINLTVNLLRSESDSTCEAAAGLLRSISAINVYKDLVAESGAIEEITGLLCRPSLISEVKEQSICTLWNLSVDGKLREKIANSDILPILVKCLDEEDIKVKEAAGGVLANLALSQINHTIMIEEGVIPKLAKFLKNDAEGSKVIRKEARNTLLELSKDEYNKILIIEQGLIPVPLIGPEAYKSFAPGLHMWPTLPDGSMIERGSQKPSRFGASELLLGLNIDEKSTDIGEAKVNAILGRTRQQFLVRIGAIELEEEDGPGKESEGGGKFTLLPSVDGVARLVLILGLDDKVAISRAAGSIADACIDEEMRMAFKEAGAVRHLVRLLGYNNEVFLFPVLRALERLSISHTVCQVIEAEGVVDPLFDTLKCKDISENLTSKTLDILARILDPNKEMRSKFNEEPANGLNIGKTANFAEKDEQKESKRNNVVDSSAVKCLVEILKSSPPNLQRKAASILEFVAITEPITEMVNSADIESALLACFRQKILEESESEIEAKQPEKYALEAEEAGLAISAASCLLSTLLDSEHFVRHLADPHQVSRLLRSVLRSTRVPLRCKDWVAACLVKLTSLLREPSDSINAEVALYEAAPRLIGRLGEDGTVGEEAAAELHRMVSEGVVDPTRAVAANGGIEPLVRMLAVEGQAAEAALGILYSLAMEGENRAEIVAAGAVPPLKRIVLSNRPQWTKALLLLRTLPT